MSVAPTTKVRWLPPAGAPRVLSVAQLTDSIGLGGYLVCSALYFTRIVGLSATQVGLGLTVGWAVGFLAGVPLGHLADRRGPRGVAMLLAASTAAALVLFLFVGSFVPFVIVASLYGASQCGLTAARQALLAGLVSPAERTRVRAVLQSAINGGIAVGAACGGIALQVDTEAAYLAVFALDAVSFVVSALVLLRLPAVAPQPRGRRRAGARGAARPALRGRRRAQHGAAAAHPADHAGHSTVDRAAHARARLDGGDAAGAQHDVRRGLPGPGGPPGDATSRPPPARSAPPAWCCWSRAWCSRCPRPGRPRCSRWPS